MDSGTPSTHPALVVAVSLDPSGDYDTHVSFLGREVRLVRVGTGGRVDDALALLTKWAGQAQVIAATGVREARGTGHFDGDLRKLEALNRTATGVPVTHGDALRNVLQEWAIRHVQAEMPGYFHNARVVPASIALWRKSALARTANLPRQGKTYATTRSTWVAFAAAASVARCCATWME